MCQYCDQDTRREEDYRPVVISTEERKRKARLQMQLDKLLRMERKFVKQGERAAAPYLAKAKKIHKAWAKVYKQL